MKLNVKEKRGSGKPKKRWMEGTVGVIERDVGLWGGQPFIVWGRLKRYLLPFALEFEKTPESIVIIWKRHLS